MKIVYGVAAFIALIALALFVAPYLIDWDGLKPIIAERAEQRFGRKLAIDGAIEVRFLPVPRVSVSDVRLANLPGGSVADMARAKRLDLELALGPLIGGRIEAVKLALVDPVIELERLPNGQANWHFEPKPGLAEAGAPATPEKAETAQPEAKKSGGGFGTAGIQSVELDNGSLTYRDPGSKRVEHLHGVEATVTAREEGGPYQARGSMKFGEAPIEFEGTLGRGTTATPTPLSLSLRLDDAAARIGFDGSIERDAGRANGTLSVEGKNLAAALQRVDITLPERTPDLAQPFTLSGAVTGDFGRFDAKQLQLRIGETAATGAVSFVSGTPNQLDLVLVLNSLDLDSLTGVEAPAKKGAGGGPAGTKLGALSPAAGPGESAETGGLKLPTDLTASINLTIEAVKYRAAVIRAVQSILSLDKGVITVQQASAELPGGADASLTGRLATQRNRAVFDGDVAVRSDDLRSLAAWLGLDLSGMPAERMRRFSMKASVKASESDVLIPKLDAKLDNSTIAGSLSIAEDGGAERPQITANLTLDRLALDGYLPRGEAAAPAKGDNPAPEAKAERESKAKEGAKPGAAGGGPLARYDVAGTINVGTLTYGELKLAGIELNPLWHDGVLTIGELKVADAAGVTLKASGEGRGLDGAAPQFSARIDASAKSLAPLGRTLDLGDSIRVDALGRTTLGLSLAGTPDKLTLDGRLATEAGLLAFKGDVENARTEPRVALDLDLANATEDTLRALFGTRPSRQAGGATPIWLRGRLSGDQNALAFAAESIAYGETELAGDVSIRFGGVRPYVTAALKSPHLAAPEGDRSRGGTDEARATQDGAAKSGAGGINGRSAAAEPAGAARWSREPFDLAALSRVDGQFKLEADRLSLGNWLTEAFAVEASLKDSVLDIERIGGRLFDGTLSGHGRVTAGERPDYALTFTLAEADIDALLRATGKADAATGRVTVEGALDAEGNSEYAIVNSLSGDVKLHGHDGTIEGVDLGAIGGTLGGLGNLGKLGDLKDSGDLLRAGLSKGSTRISALDGTVRFANGIGRTDDTHVVADAGVGDIAGEADLPRWHLDMTATFTVNQPAGMPPFGVRLLGPIDKPTRQFNVDPLMASIGEKLKQRLLDDEHLKLKLRKGAKAEPGSLADQVLRGVLGDPDAGLPEPVPQTPPQAESPPVLDSTPEALPEPLPEPVEAAPPEPVPQSVPEPEPAPPPKPRLKDLLKQVIPELSKRK